MVSDDATHQDGVTLNWNMDTVSYQIGHFVITVVNYLRRTHLYFKEKQSIYVNLCY